MKRFRRIAVNITAALSLLLFAADVGLWVRSYATADLLLRFATDKPPGASTTRPAIPFVGRQILAFASVRGRFECGYTKESYSSFSLVPDGWKHAALPTPLVANTPAASRGTLGFGYYHEAVPSGVVITEKGVPINDPATAAPLAEAWTSWVPCWFVALLTAIDPAVWFWSLGRRPSPPGFEAHGTKNQRLGKQ